MLVDVASGAIAQRLDVDEFGRVTSDTNPGFQPFGFGGGLYDADTGLVRFGARDYDAFSGRWTAKDPALFGGGTANLYEYCYGDPINFIDMTGRKPDPAVEAAQARFDAAYQEWRRHRAPAFRNWGPASNWANGFIEDAPVCVDYATDAAEFMNDLVGESNVRAYPVWNFQEPSGGPLGDFVNTDQPHLFNSHNTVQVYMKFDDGSVGLVRSYDPWIAWP